MKNLAFAALERAEVEIYKRGKLGPVPASWLARREQLAQAYAQARAAVRAYTLEVLDYGSGERWEAPAAGDPALAAADDPAPQAPST